MAFPYCSEQVFVSLGYSTCLSFFRSDSVFQWQSQNSLCLIGLVIQVPRTHQVVGSRQQKDRNCKCLKEIPSSLAISLVNLPDSEKLLMTCLIIVRIPAVSQLFWISAQLSLTFCFISLAFAQPHLPSLTLLPAG